MSRETAKLLEEQKKLEKELEKMKVKNDDGGAVKGIIFGIIVFLMPFIGIFTVESFTGKMVCLGISLLISLLILNWYNQTNKKKKRLKTIKQRLKELSRENGSDY